MTIKKNPKRKDKHMNTPVTREQVMEQAKNLALEEAKKAEKNRKKGLTILVAIPIICLAIIGISEFFKNESAAGPPQYMTDFIVLTFVGERGQVNIKTTDGSLLNADFNFKRHNYGNQRNDPDFTFRVKNQTYLMDVKNQTLGLCRYNPEPEHPCTSEVYPVAKVTAHSRLPMSWTYVIEPLPSN